VKGEVKEKKAKEKSKDGARLDHPSIDFFL
jgi:hypothetical protein